MELAFTILGRTQLRIAGSFVSGTAKPWQILAALLAQPDKPMSVGTLINWVWTDGEDPPRNARDTFHTYRSRIQTLLREMDVDAEVVGRNRALSLSVNRLQVDYHRFRALLDEARQIKDSGDLRMARDVLLRAVELWRGPPLADLRTVAAARWRRTVTENQWLPANVMLVDLHLSLGEPDRALVRLDELREDRKPTNIQVMQRLTALWRLDRSAEYSEFYMRVQRALHVAGDDEAAAELRRFHDTLTKNRPTVGVPKSTENDRPPVLVLPHAPPSLVGRERLLSRLDAVATNPDGRLRAAVVTLEGPSGVGKTTLAGWWARRRHDQHGDEVVFVDLHGFSTARAVDADAAVEELLDMLGFPVSRIEMADRRGAKLRELLSGRRLIVVLDNVRDYEHILPLLRLLSEALVLVTTRQRLTKLDVSHGASVVRVPLLAMDDAVELLAERIGERARRDPESVSRLAEVCGGLPMALTLVTHAVVRREEIALGEFADRLADPAALLQLGADGDGNSLGTAFTTSYHALRDQERAVFRLLGQCPAPEIDLMAATALTGLPMADCRHALEILDSAHLIEHADSLDRWRLHDLLRAYAVREAGNDHSAEAMRRLLDYYLHSAHAAHQMVFPHRGSIPIPKPPNDVTPMRFADARQGAEWCVRERANLAAALTFAARNNYLEHSWQFANVIDILRRYGWRSIVAEALVLATESAKRLDNREAEASAHHDAAYLALSGGDYETARRHLQYALVLAQSVGTDLGVATSLLHVGKLELHDGKIESAIDRYETALRMVTKAGNTHISAVVGRYLGDAYRSAKQYEKAFSYYHSSLRMSESIGHQEGRAETLAAMSRACVSRGIRDDYEMAIEYARQAIELIPEVADLDLEQRAHGALAEALLSVGRIDDAVAASAETVRLAAESHAAGAEAEALDLHARALWRSGRPAEAADAWRRCAEIHRDRGDHTAAASAERRLADAVGFDGLPAARENSVDFRRHRAAE